jgi:hypothetical protein
VNVTSRLSTVWPRPVRLKISGTLSPVRSRSTTPSRTIVSPRTGVVTRTVASSVPISLVAPSLRSRPLPNGSRLSCGALKKDSFPNLGAPPASSAC